MYRLHLKSEKSNLNKGPARRQQADSEYEGSTFIQNASGLLPDYTASEKMVLFAAMDVRTSKLTEKDRVPRTLHSVWNTK
jgi:hypothetical protein